MRLRIPARARCLHDNAPRTLHPVSQIRQQITTLHVAAHFPERLNVDTYVGASSLDVRRITIPLLPAGSAGALTFVNQGDVQQDNFPDDTASIPAYGASTH